MATAAWTMPDELVSQLSRLWERGDLLRAKLVGEQLFPKQLRLRRPTAKDLGARFDEVRQWIRALEEGSRTHGYTLQLEQIVHRQLGRNSVPGHVVVPTEADALRMIGKTRAAERFNALRARISTAFPVLESWIAKHPMKVLEHEERWDRLLSVLRWFADHPHSGLYRRQLEIESVDTKFIEDQRQVLTELLERVLPPDALVGERGASFDRRFGLREKSLLVRFRLLDDSQHISGLSDLSIPAADLARLPLLADDIIVTENEVNGLALLPRPRTVVIFGHGYALEKLGDIRWLASRRLLYWGDIDTHGFAMLNRFRAHFPQAESFLMDRATFLAHRPMWVVEPEPNTEPVTRLTESERGLHRELIRGTHGERLRLEQERIGYRWVRHALSSLAPR
jgi:hypothetical protein